MVIKPIYQCLTNNYGSMLNYFSPHVQSTKRPAHVAKAKGSKGQEHPSTSAAKSQTSAALRYPARRRRSETISELYNAYMHVDVYMIIHVYDCICKCMCMYANTYMYVYTYMYIYIYILRIDI